MSKKTDYPFGVERGSIEDSAFDVLRNAIGGNPEIDRQIVQTAMLHSIATSLVRIADYLGNVER